MRYWNRVVPSVSLALLLVITGCSKVDVSGAWNGHMSDANSEKPAATDLQAQLQQTSHGLSGTLTWRNTSGAWQLMEGDTLVVSSGDVFGSRVSFVAAQNLPGGSLTVDFKGKVQGTTMKGVANVTVGSVMGGDTFIGNLVLARK